MEARMGQAPQWRLGDSWEFDPNHEYYQHIARIPLPDGEGTERQRLWTLRPAFAEAAKVLATAVYDKSHLPLRVSEMVRMRIAQINDCPI